MAYSHRKDDVLEPHHDLGQNTYLYRIIAAAPLLLAIWEHFREVIHFLNDFVNRLQ